MLSAWQAYSGAWRRLRPVAVSQVVCPWCAVNHHESSLSLSFLTIALSTPFRSAVPPIVPLALFSGTLLRAKPLAFSLTQEKPLTELICTPLYPTSFRRSQILQAQQIIQNWPNAEKQSMHRRNLATRVPEVCYLNSECIGESTNHLVAGIDGVTHNQLRQSVTLWIASAIYFDADSKTRLNNAVPLRGSGSIYF